MRERPCRRLTQNFATGGIVGHTHVEDDDDDHGGVAVLSFVGVEDGGMAASRMVLVGGGEGTIPSSPAVVPGLADPSCPWPGLTTCCDDGGTVATASPLIVHSVHA